MSEIQQPDQQLEQERLEKEQERLEKEQERQKRQQLAERLKSLTPEQLQALGIDAQMLDWGLFVIAIALLALPWVIVLANLALA